MHIQDGNVKQNKFPDIDLMSDLFIKQRENSSQYLITFADQQYYPEIIIGNCVFPSGIESISLSEFSQAKPVSIPTMGTNVVLSTGANDVSIIVTQIYNSTFAQPQPKPYVVYSPTNSQIGLLADLYSLLQLCKLFPIVPVYSYQLKSLINSADIDRQNTLLYPKDNVTFCAIETVQIEYIKELPGSVRVTLQLLPTQLNKTTEYDFMTVKYKDGLGVKEQFFTSGEIYTEVVNHRNKSIPKELQTIYSDLQSHRITLEIDKDFVQKSIYYNLVTDLQLIFDANQYNPQNVTFDNISKTVNDLSTKLQTTQQAQQQAGGTTKLVNIIAKYNKEIEDVKSALANTSKIVIDSNEQDVSVISLTLSYRHVFQVQLSSNNIIPYRQYMGTTGWEGNIVISADVDPVNEQKTVSQTSVVNEIIGIKQYTEQLVRNHKDQIPAVPLKIGGMTSQFGLNLQYITNIDVKNIDNSNSAIVVNIPFIGIDNINFVSFQENVQSNRSQQYSFIDKLYSKEGLNSNEQLINNIYNNIAEVDKKTHTLKQDIITNLKQKAKDLIKQFKPFDGLVDKQIEKIADSAVNLEISNILASSILIYIPQFTYGQIGQFQEGILDYDTYISGINNTDYKQLKTIDNNSLVSKNKDNTFTNYGKREQQAIMPLQNPNQLPSEIFLNTTTYIQRYIVKTLYSSELDDTYYDQVIAILLTSQSGNDLFYRTTPTMQQLGDAKTTTANMQDDVANVGTYLAQLKTYAQLNPSTKVNINSNTFIGKFLSLFLYTPSKNLMNTLATSKNTYYAAYGVWDQNYVADNPIFSLETVLQPYTGPEDDEQYKTGVFFKINKSNNVKYQQRIREIIDNYTFKYNNTFISTMASQQLAYIFSERMPSTLGVQIDAMFVTDSENIYDIMTKFSTISKYNMFDWITKDSSAPMKYAFTWENVEGTEQRRKYVQEQLNIMLVSMAFVNLFYDMPGTVINMQQQALSSNESIIEKLFKTISSWLWPFVLVKNAIIELQDNNFDITKGNYSLEDIINIKNINTDALFYDFYNKFKTFLPEPVQIMLQEQYYQIISKQYDANSKQLNQSKIIVDLYEPGKNNGQPQVQMKNYFNAIVYLNRYIANFILGTKTNYQQYYEMMKYNTLMTMNMDQLIETIMLIEDKLASMIENELVLAGVADIDIGGYPLIDFEQYYRIQWADEIEYSMTSFAEKTLERTKQYLFKVYLEQQKIMYNRNIDNDTGEPINDTQSTSYVESAYTAVEYTSAKDQEDQNTQYKLIARYQSNDQDSRLIKNLNVLALMSTQFSGFDITNKDQLNQTTDENGKPIKLEYKQVGIDSQTKQPVEILTTKDLSLSDYYEKTRESIKSQSQQQISRQITQQINPETVTMTNAQQASNGQVNYTTPVSNAIQQIDYALLSSNTLNNIEYNIRLSQGNNSIDKQNEIISSQYNMNQLLLGNYKQDINQTADIQQKTQEQLSQVVQYSPNRIVFNTMQLSELYLSLYYAQQLDAGYATKLQLSPKQQLVLIQDNGRYKSGYAYGQVLDVQVSREQDNPVDVQTIVIPGPNVMTSQPDLNMYEVLSYKVVYNQPQWQPVFSMLQPGQDIEIRIGYTKKVNKMGKVFAGYIRDTQYNQDGTITIVAEGYGSVLARPVFEKSDHINQFFLDPRQLIVKQLSKVGSYKLGYVATSSIIESILLKSDDQWLFAQDDKKYLAAVSYQPFAENLYYPTDYWTGLRSGQGSQLYFANFEMHFANYTIQPGSSAWDVIDDQLSMQPDFIQQVEPIEELGQARVFFGKPTWPFKFQKVSDYIGSKADTYINSQLAIILQANRNILKMSDPNFVANESNDQQNPDNQAGTVWTPTNSPQNSKTVKYINYKTHSQSALNSQNDIELLLICQEMNQLQVAGINRKSQLSAAINNLNQKLQALTNDVNKVYKPLIDKINDISYIHAETKVILSALKEMLTFITDTNWYDTVIDFVATVDSTVDGKKYTTIYGYKLSDTNSFKWPTSENTWFYNPQVLSVITSVSNQIQLANQKKQLERLYSILEVNSTKYGYWQRKGYQIRSVFNWNQQYTVPLSDFNPFRRSGRETLRDQIIEGPNKKFKQAEIDRALNYITPVYYSLQELQDTSPKTSKNKMPLHKTGKQLQALTQYQLDILSKQSNSTAYQPDSLMLNMFNDFLNKGLKDKNNVEQSIGSINLMLNYINKTVYYTDLKIKEFKKELSNVFAYTIQELLRFDINPMSMKRLSDGAEFNLQSITGQSIKDQIAVLRKLVQNENKYYNCKSPAGENAADQSVANIAQDIENIAIKYLGPSGFIIQHKNGSKIKYANDNEATITELYNQYDTRANDKIPVSIGNRLIADQIKTLIIDKSDKQIEYIYSMQQLQYQPNIKLDFRESGQTIPNMKYVNNNFVLQHQQKQITSLKDLQLNIFKMLNAAMTINGSSNDPQVVEQQKAINTAINTQIDGIAGTIDVFISKYYDIATAIQNNNKNVNTIKNTQFGLFEKLLDLPNKIMIFVDKYKQAYSMMIEQAQYIGDTMEKTTKDSKPMNQEECINYITSMYYLQTIVSLLAEQFMIQTFNYRKSDIMNQIVENIKDIAGFKADHQITIDDISLLLQNNLNDIQTDIENVSSNINTRLITIKTDQGTNASKYGVTSSAPQQTVSSTSNVTADNRRSQQTTTTKNELSKEQQFALYNQQYQDTLTELQNNTSDITSKISANSSIQYNLKNFQELFNQLLTQYKRDHMIDTTRGLFNLQFFDATDNKRGLLADKAKLYPVGTKPFADYHIIDDRIIIKNTISLNYNMANKIILYSPTYMQSINFITPVTKLFESLFPVISNDYEVINGQHMQVTEQIFDEDIPNEYTKALTVTTNYGNIPQTRILIATYHLKKSLETMYSGQLIIVGKPNIKPYDYIQILDSYNMIVGMQQVSSVMHIMSQETGYITQLGVMPIVETRDLHYDSLGYTLFQIFNYAAGIALLGGNNLFQAAGHTIGQLKTGMKGLSAAGQSLLKFAKKIGSKTTRKVMFQKVVTKHMQTGQQIYNQMDYWFLPGNETGDGKQTITVDKVYNPVSIKILQKNGYMFAPNLMGSYLDNINVFHEQTKNFQYTWNNVVLQTNDIFYSINSFGFTDQIKRGVANQLISDL